MKFFSENPGFNNDMFGTRRLPDGTIELCRYQGDDLRVILPDSIDGTPVTSIGPGFFFGSNPVDTLHIPAGISGIHPDINPFNFAPGLAYITVDADSPCFTAVDGVLFSKDMTTLLCYPACRHGSHYHVPDSVRAIRDGAFTGCEWLVSLDLPDGVTDMGFRNFANCRRLARVNVPARFNGKSALFNDCPCLSDLRLNAASETFALVDGVLFSKDMTTLVCYPAGKRNTVYTIPEGVTTIADHAFNGNPALITVRFPASLRTIGEQAFSNCTALNDVLLPAGLEDLQTEAFSGCESLAWAVLPAGLAHIGSNPFSGCESLEDLFITPGQSRLAIADGALIDRERAALICYPAARPGSTFCIPDGVTNIRGKAFADACNLTDVVIPGSVTELAGFALCAGDFSAIRSIVFTVEHGSPAEEYCLDGGYNIRYMDSPSPASAA